MLPPLKIEFAHNTQRSPSWMPRCGNFLTTGTNPLPVLPLAVRSLYSQNKLLIFSRKRKPERNPQVIFFNYFLAESLLGTTRQFLKICIFGEFYTVGMNRMKPSNHLSTVNPPFNEVVVSMALGSSVRQSGLKSGQGLSGAIW